MKHYLFFTRNALPQPRADLVQVANCANAAANLGYSAVLGYLRPNSRNPLEWLHPFCPQPPTPELKQFYNLQDRLQVAALPIPWLSDHHKNTFTHPSTIISKYYFPVHIRRNTKIVHTRDWNFVKAAVRSGIPAIYEHHHHEAKPFEPEIVQHPLFQIAITVVDTVRESMIQQGMPPDKVVTLHNGFNQAFLTRHPVAAEAWRNQLLTQHQYLAVYSGGLYSFKGVDLLIEAAKLLPSVQFVFAGGNDTQVATYRQFAIDHQVENVQFLGYLRHDQLVSLLQAADVLVHPHRLTEEATYTSPLKFFEYMASGTPIVATKIPPLMPFQASGVIAGWCEPDQPLQLAQGIQQVLTTHPRRTTGYTGGMEFVQQFSWENRIRKILSYVETAYQPV
ncbi:MAG: glycosyltransferase family 4 protein [Elainella sp. Prado103]|jgi:glycosyltransferase involved in cell wall biosynthesis|nr:glycosyltransferase family 4 protein [Elainella sp. Prado103]